MTLEPIRHLPSCRTNYNQDVSSSDFEHTYHTYTHTTSKITTRTNGIYMDDPYVGFIPTLRPHPLHQNHLPSASSPPLSIITSPQQHQHPPHHHLSSPPLISQSTPNELPNTPHDLPHPRDLTRGQRAPVQRALEARTRLGLGVGLGVTPFVVPLGGISGMKVKMRKWEGRTT